MHHAKINFTETNKYHWLLEECLGVGGRRRGIDKSRTDKKNRLPISPHTQVNKETAIHCTLHKAFSKKNGAIFQYLLTILFYTNSHYYWPLSITSIAGSMLYIPNQINRGVMLLQFVAIDLYAEELGGPCPLPPTDLPDLMNYICCPIFPRFAHKSTEGILFQP